MDLAKIEKFEKFFDDEFKKVFKEVKKENKPVFLNKVKALESYIEELEAIIIENAF